MIQIEHPEIEKISRVYFDKIKEKIQSRCNFLQLVIDTFLLNGSEDVLDSKILGSNSKKAIINILLKKDAKIKKLKQLENISKNNLEQWVIDNCNLVRKFCIWLVQENQIEELILGKPEKLISIEEKFKTDIGLTEDIDSRVYEILKHVLGYSMFDEFSYYISKELNINTCPYCNRNYISTVINVNGKRILRPTFDHFFSQKSHPLLTLSFFNLIPCCYFCNSSLKGGKPVSLETHIHPYLEGFDQDAKFGITLKDLCLKKSDPENFSLELFDNMISNPDSSRYRKIFGGTKSKKNEKEGNLNLFRLEDVYSSHLDIVGELRVKVDMLNLTYGQTVVEIFPQILGVSLSEFYLYYFGNYFDKSDFNKRPLAKFTKDIISQMMPGLGI